MSKSRRTIPITYRNMPLRKSSYQRDLEMNDEYLTQRLRGTLLAIGLVFLVFMIVNG
jgi:hypothetical protein